MLHYRLREAYRDRLTPQIGSYADLLPRHLPEHARVGLLGLAEAADARRAELGARLAADPPQWAREALGPVPDARRPRSGPRGSSEPVGPAPTASSPSTTTLPTPSAPPRPAAWPRSTPPSTPPTPRSGCPRSAPPRRTCPKASCAPTGHAWQRELNTAPRYVADELDATHDALRRARDRRHRLGRPAPRPRPTRSSATSSPPPPRQARERAAQLAEQVQQLEYADHARSVFLTDTAVTHDLAERARVAAGWRGIDLTDTSDRVPADRLARRPRGRAGRRRDRPADHRRRR